MRSRFFNKWLLTVLLLLPVSAYAASIITIDWGITSGTYSSGAELGASRTVSSFSTYSYGNSGDVFTGSWSNILSGYTLDSRYDYGISVGYTSSVQTTTITFSSAVTNPYLVFNYTDSSSTTWDFSGNGQSATTLVNSNGGGSYSLSSDTVTSSGASDLVSDGFAVQLTGSFTSISFDITSAASGTAGFTVGLDGYTATTTVGSNGTATISSTILSASSTTTQVVEAGASDTLTYTFSPSSGYTVDLVSSSTTCGGSITSTSYTTSSITADCTISVEFSVSPTVIITSAEVSSGGSSNDSTLSLTFTTSEATSTFVSGDVTISNGSISSFSASSSTVYTATLTPSASGSVTIDIAANTFTGTVTSNANLAATQFTWTYSSSSIATPLTKTDVAGSSRAINSVTTRFSQFSIKMANKRMQWLNRNRWKSNQSYQGIQFSFSDPLLQEFFNGSSRRASEIQLADAASAIRRFANHTDVIMSDVQDTVTELALAELRDGIGTVNLNPVGGTVYKDWSLWTEGEISVGKIRESGDSAEQKTKGFAVTVGMDRPYREGHRVGASFSFGKDDIDVGTSGSAVDSDNYSLSFYSAMQYSDLPRIEGVMGLGYMNIDTLRIDGSESLTGDRKAHALFGSVAVHKAPLIRGKYTISPYGRLELVYTELDDYAESGGSLALTYDQQEITSTMVFVGTQIEYAGFTPNGRITPFGAIEYGLDLSSSSDAAMRYTTESTSYSLSQDKLAASHWMLKFGADYLLHDGSTSTFEFERNQAGSAGYNNTVRFRLNIPF